MFKLYYYYAQAAYYFLKFMKFTYKNLQLIINCIILLSFIILIIKNNPSKKEPEKIKAIKQGFKKTIKDLILINLIFFTYYYILKKINKYCGPLDSNRFFEIIQCSFITFYQYLKNNLEAIPHHIGFVNPILIELLKIAGSILATILFVITVKNTWENAEKTGQEIYG
jgi:hypothetical protein